MCAASPALALKLKWANGADTLSFMSAQRCALVLTPDSTEQALPQEWRIAWLADSLGVRFVTEDSLEACDLDTAKVSSIEPPGTPADSAANLITARLCSESGPAVPRAQFLIDQPGGSAGRLKVVALDPGDPGRVIESNEVSYNGGVLGDYPPVLLSASSTHQTAMLDVTAIGWNLDSVITMRVGAADTLWSVDLAIGERTSTRISGSAEVTAELPEALVQVSTATGASDHTRLPAESFSVALMNNGSIDTVLFHDPNPSVYPKDFAFFYNSVYDPTDPDHPWKGVYHLFYIRNFRGTGLDSIIAHAWTDTLNGQWKFDSLAFRPSGQGWDAKKVWAPSIQQVGDLYYMFYTGVDANGDQSIGYATTPMLGRTNIAWTRNSMPAYTSFDTDWADRDGHEQEGILAFRDPFVMPDPDHEGRYLLFNAGEDGELSTTSNPGYAVGVARNVAGTMASWLDIGKYEATDQVNLPVSGAIESPLVVRDSLTGAWRLFVANADYDDDGYYSTIFLTQNPGDSLTNLVADAWPERDSLYAYLDADADVIAWQACEHLQIGQVHFFAAYEGNGIGITRMHWDEVSGRFVIAYPSTASAGATPDGQALGLRLAEYRPESGIVRFGVDAHGGPAKLNLYDVSGRRTRRLLDGRTSVGRADVLWDCRDEAGSRVPTGVYFARLTSGSTSRVIRVPVLR